MKTCLERDLDPHEKANLILALGPLLEHTNEEQRFLLGLTQSHEHDVVTFAAALILTQQAKKDTPSAVVQFLAKVMMDAPKTLNDFRDLPLGGNPGGNARHMLYNLESQHLEFLVPAVLDRWPEVSQEDFSSLQWAQFLLFVLFQGTVGPEKQRSPFPPHNSPSSSAISSSFLRRTVQPDTLTIFGNCSDPMAFPTRQIPSLPIFDEVRGAASVWPAKI
ncbi:MAG TPA: hypothetical protein VFN35_17385 [Ktedonobacteraceae bacterium]|nr:hypothetical protein [Ktedonobacteraceae bacterium]